MSKIYEKIIEIVNVIRTKTDFVPDVAVVLGSGLGEFGEKIDVKCVVDYKDLPNFPVSTVSGHKGRFLFGYVGDTKVVCMQGRVHYYEGYSMQDVVLPIRVMKVLGAETLLLTNAAGGINESFKAGDLMQITGHISSFVPSPLIGETLSEFAPTFPDMSEVYDKGLAKKISEIACKVGVTLRQGVYLQTTGPNYETPEEIKAFRVLGADAVGMSTTVEAVAAVSMGMKVCGISLITNMAAGVSKTKLSHEEVKEQANKSSEEFTRLVSAILTNI